MYGANELAVVKDSAMAFIVSIKAWETEEAKDMDYVVQ